MHHSHNMYVAILRHKLYVRTWLSLHQCIWTTDASILLLFLSSNSFLSFTYYAQNFAHSKTILFTHFLLIKHITNLYYVRKHLHNKPLSRMHEVLIVGSNSNPLLKLFELKKLKYLLVLSTSYCFSTLIMIFVSCSIFFSTYFAPIMLAFYSMLLPSYYAKNFASKIDTSLIYVHNLYSVIHVGMDTY